jgi:hypothetical protein
MKAQKMYSCEFIMFQKKIVKTNFYEICFYLLHPTAYNNYCMLQNFFLLWTVTFIISTPYIHNIIHGHGYGLISRALSQICLKILIMKIF